MVYCQPAGSRHLQEQDEAVCDLFIGPGGILPTALQHMVRHWTAGGISRCGWRLNLIVLAGR